MTFKLSKRSLDRLKGVHPKLVETVNMAIKDPKLKIDFGVTCGVRTLETQKKLVAQKRSQTLKSKHLMQEDNFSHAVDLVAYDDGEVCWEADVYDDIADAMLRASKHVDLKLIWGAAWHCPDMRTWSKSCEELNMQYQKLRLDAGRRPFNDYPHFQCNFDA